MADNATVVGEDVGNTGGDKYETTAREIQNGRFSTFCSKWRMTFRKVTPAALKVNVKKFWQVLLVPWHVWAPIWVHFAPWWSIFPVKNRFSHIFPAPEGSPFLTVILTVKLARLVWVGAFWFRFLYCSRHISFHRFQFRCDFECSTIFLLVKVHTKLTSCSDFRKASNSQTVVPQQTGLH